METELSLFFAFSFLLASAFFVTVPQTVRLFYGWRQTQKVPTFSWMILMIVLSFYLVAIAYKIGMNLALNYTSQIFANLKSTWTVEIVPLILIFLIITLIQTILIPKSLQFYKKWQSTKKPLCFSLMSFFCTASLFCFSYIFLWTFMVV